MAAKGTIRTGTVRAGIGGWTFAPWRGTFFPKGLPHTGELEFASRALSTIEINGTFYRHQTEATFAKWGQETPDDFVFSVKARRATTHGREPADAIARFLGSGLEALGSKLGPIFWQFPPTRKFEAAAMERFLALLPASLHGTPLRHAVEARHASFLEPAWFDLLRAHGIAHVIIDSDKQVLRTEVTADFVYVRLQRNAAAEPEGYNAEALDLWAAHAKTWAKAGRDCFITFISGDKERAPDSARAFIGRL